MVLWPREELLPLATNSIQLAGSAETSSFFLGPELQEKQLEGARGRGGIFVHAATARYGGSTSTATRPSRRLRTSSTVPEGATLT